jgi:SAM-dependent methyltransferase
MTADRRHAESVVANFDQEAPRWQRNYADGAGAMQPRLALFAEALGQAVPPPACVLDFGCGTGELGRALAARGWQVSGCDASPAMLAVARAEAPHGSWVQLEPMADRPLPFEPASFDAVVASSVFEYLADPGATLHQLAVVLRPGGWLFLTVPDPRSVLRQREAFWLAIARSAPCWAVLRHTRWRLYFSYLRLSINRFPLERWGALLAQAGFEPAPIPASSGPLALLAARKGP